MTFAEDAWGVCLKSKWHLEVLPRNDPRNAVVDVAEEGSANQRAAEASKTALDRAKTQGSTFYLVRRTGDYWQPVAEALPSGQMMVIHMPVHISSTRRTRRAFAARSRQAARAAKRKGK